MALKLKTKTSKLKTAAKKKTKQVNGIEAATELVSTAHDLKAQISALDAKAAVIKKELAPIEAQMLEMVEPEIAGDESVDLINDEGQVCHISGKQQTRKIKDVEEVVDKLEEFEEGLAIKIAKFNLGDLDKYFSPEEMAVLCEIKEGNRRLTYK